jgi:hypothetical protein
MTRLELRTLIRKDLGETTAAFWTDTELNTWIENACNDLAFRAKCIKDNGKMTMTEDQAEYTLSSYFSTALAVLEVYYYQDATSWEVLKPTTRDLLNREHPGWKSADSGTPTEYYWDREEDIIGFYVKPDSTNAGVDYAEVYYAKEHSAMTADTETPDIPIYLQPAIADHVVATGYSSRGWNEKANDAWQKYFSKIHDYQVERHREREDEDIIMKGTEVRGSKSERLSWHQDDPRDEHEDGELRTPVQLG